MPEGVRPAALSLRAWQSVLTHPVLMAMVAVTALSGAGQFTLFSYFTPYYKTQVGASAEQITLLLMWFGLFGLVGNVVLTRVVDRVGPHAAATIAMILMAASLVLWPLGGTSFVAVALVLVPWGLGCFSSNSAQQARLGQAAPTLAPALMALNTSAIYVGQAAGAGSGGWLIAHTGYAWLNWAGLAWMALAIGVSLWAARQRVSFA